ncbi:unnamed protein product [Brassicogethes aeneus]|uniref:Fukutin-related protein n=1 Tax=Brassicogethes aeneus TaxID=1431903 RepID=A0A9P0AYX7_BRAAE|nr:unnamed protein product [Brassicogethes aeneus]
MRFKPTKSLTIFIFIIFCFVFFYAFRFFVSKNYIGLTTLKPLHKPLNKSSTKPSLKHLSKLITVIIREFEPNDNDVTLTAQSFVNVFPSINVLILYDSLPYPPLDITLTNTSLTNVKLVNLSPNLRSSIYERYPIFQIKTTYVLFVPDSARITSRQSLQLMVNKLAKNQDSIIVAPLKSSKKDLKCLRINVSAKEWTLRYSCVKSTTCDAVSGKHLILIKTELLQKLTYAFFLPFPQSFYIQTSVMSQKVKILDSVSFHDGKPIIKSHHAQWKRKQIDAERFKKLYVALKIKQVVREFGSTEWYGCNRDTPRCFGSIVDSMPSYLYEKKWTPPCCLSNLKKTAKYVFNILDETGIRYWLEAGSLLGAMRSGDILPWDHDVDIGFNRDDLYRCNWLKKAREKPVVDNKGFLWEKATEGNFYRVYFSKANRIHVNLFPFFTKNGTMTRDSWFTSHKNMEFPDNFLHPMSSIEFIGRNVPSPNNIRDFLEIKFGKGSIENPEYPDPNKIKFP